MADLYAPLSAVIVRALSDKVYDKRKTAASEIAKRVRDHASKNDADSIKKIIKILVSQILDQGSNSRIGGLMGLAAVSVGLGISAIDPFVPDLVMPIFPAFKDNSPHVRYYATESLYNVAIVARGSILERLNEIFYIIIELSMDKDQNVRNGVDLLDNAMKAIIVESSAFDLVAFIPVLREKLYMGDNAVQTRVMSWVTLLQGVPDVNLVPFLPDLIDGIFKILESPRLEVKAMTETAIGKFILAIRKHPDIVNYTDIINILIGYARSDDTLVQVTALTWVLDFIKLSKRKMLPYSSGIFNAAIPCIAYEDAVFANTKSIAEEICNSLTALITLEDDLKDESNDINDTQDDLELASVMEVALVQLKNTPVPCKTMVLKLIYHLNETISFRMQNYVDDLFDSLLKTISDPSDEVVLLVMQVLAQIASSDFPFDKPKEKKSESDSLRGGKFFTRFLQSLLQLFAGDRNILKSRGSFVVRQLCILLSAEEVYCKFAELLLLEDDLPFATELVQHLSSILLTSKELVPLRRKLSHLDTQENCNLFVKLYRSWCHSPVATLTLCLLAQKYDHAATIVHVFGELEVSTDFLLELDKLIQLIESPIFTFLRLQLLSAAKNPALVETLYGVLMLLPQTEVFHLLRCRLNCVPPPHLIRASADAVEVTKEELHIDFVALLNDFNDTQKRHRAFKQKELIERLQSTMVISNT